jgi:exonuclease SbcD
MRLLHTSDLHYGMTWRGISRRADQHRVLAEIVSICEAKRVDALVVTGDVFSDRPEGHPADVIRLLLQQLRPQLERGCPVVLLRGNHDSLG